MYAEERHEAIADLVTRRGRVSVGDLAERFDVTTETIRRDLAALERRGHVRRVHGGAVPASALTVTEPGVGERDTTRSAAKDRIAAAALALLPPHGGSAVFDAGTTTGRLAAALPADLVLTVVTNSVPIAARLATASALTLHTLGGRVRGVTQAAVGPRTLDALSRLHVDVAFVGTNGLGVDSGLTTPDEDEAAVKESVVRAADKVVVLADSTKVGRRHLHRFAPLDAIDVLVTDHELDPADHRHFVDHGLEVITA